jgi:hypothetical protein
MTSDVAVVIPLKLVYTPVDDTVTAPLYSTSTSTSGLRSRVCGQSLRPSLAPNHFWLPTTYLLLR